MLHLSGLTIPLGKSSHYLRLVYLLHAFALVVLFNSALPWSVMAGFGVILICSVVLIARSKTPMPACKQLDYYVTHWLLHDMHGQSTRFERAFISFDAGLFILLTLSGMQSTRKLVIFTDQLSSFQYRALFLIARGTSPPMRGTPDNKEKPAGPER